MSKLPLICVDDYEKHAIEKLGQYAGLIVNGADDSITANDNKRAYKRYLILPRVLNTAPHINLSTTILGQRISFPVCASPSAYHSLANEKGELASARGVTSLGTMFVLTHWSDHKIEDVARVMGGEGKGLLLAQLNFLAGYTHLTLDYMQRAEQCGAKAFVVTVDQTGRSKKRDARRLTAQGQSHVNKFANFPAGLITDKEWGTKFIYDSSLSWARIHALRQHTSLPIIAKGIITEADAISAIEEGHVDAIIVSNHGGRQLDSVPATLDALPRIVRAVNGRCEVYMDGGIRTGSDVFKALALGARAVFVGRPIIYGLSYDGENGVRQVMELLRDELRSTMALTGCANLSQITRSHVVSRREYLSQL